MIKHMYIFTLQDYNHINKIIIHQLTSMNAIKQSSITKENKDDTKSVHDTVKHMLTVIAIQYYNHELYTIMIILDQQIIDLSSSFFHNTWLRSTQCRI